MEYQPGDMILNKYKVEELIGEGAYGLVYKAAHPQLSSRALKVLRRDMDGVGSSMINEAEKRFLLEARLGDEVKDKHLVQVYDFEKDKDTLALVMEYCPGGNLKERIRKAYKGGGEMAIEDAVLIGFGAAEGLAALHKRDIVHRDVKPSNILFGSGGEAKVGDLGLVQTPYSRMSGGSLAGEHPGTAEYMPLEQTPGHTMPLKANADVYALGCVVFEMLTGRMYYHQDKGTKPGALRKGVPSWLDDLVLRMLAEKAEERPKNGEEVSSLIRAGWQAEKQKVAAEQARKDAERKERVWREGVECSLREHEEKARHATEQKSAEVIVLQETAERRLRGDRFREEQRKPEGTAETERKRFNRVWVISVSGLVGLGFLGVWWIISKIPAQNINRQPTKMVANATLTSIPQDTPVPVAVIAGPSCDQVGLSWASPKDGMEMVCVPTGEFNMGNKIDDYWLPLHKVFLDAFWIDRTEVTNGMYSNCKTDGKCRDTYHVWTDSFILDFNGENQPVMGVTWNDAKAYCEWAGRRLPTEAEWEKAARGTDGRKYPWGNQPPDAQHVNYKKNVGKTTDVGSYPLGVSPYGALDMAGNLEEWVADWYDREYYQSRSDWNNPIGPTSSDDNCRVTRGGSYYDYQNLDNAIISYSRSCEHPEVILDRNGVYIKYGFRCARSALP